MARAAALIATSVGLLSACGGDVSSGRTPPVSVEGLESLAIQPSTISVGLDDSMQLAAIGTYEDGNSADLTGQVDWAMLDGANTASVSGTGLLTGNALGTASVTATEPESGLHAVALVTVKPFSQEGSPADPVAVSEGTAHNGEVNTGSSYYAIDVTAGWYYYTFLSGISDDDVRLYVYDDAGFAVELCSATAVFDGELSCVTQPPPSDSKLYVRVDGAFTDTFFGGPGGATYVLEVVRGYIDEGEQGTPIEVAADTARESMVGRWASYYLVPVVPGGEYRIELSGMTADVDLGYQGYVGNYYADRCNRGLDGLAVEQCLLRTTSDALELSVYGGKTRTGAAFSLIVETTGAPLAAEGTASAPQSLSGTGPFLGQVDNTNSYYAYAVTPGRSYRVELLDATGELWMDVYEDDATFSDPTCQVSNDYTLDHPMLCELTPTTGSMLYIRVRGDNSPVGATYQLRIEEIAYADEGTTTPVLLEEPPTSRSGQVDTGQSHYQVPVQPGALYNVALTHLVNDVDLYVYDDQGESVLLCSSANSGRQDESCITNSRPTSSTLFIRVDGAASVYGASFLLTIHRIYEAEGTAAAPKNIDASNQYAGQVGHGSAASYYALAVTAGKSYRLAVTNSTDSIFFRLHNSTADFGSSGSCNSWANPDAQCDHGPTTGDLLYLEVLASYTDFGAAFDLTLSELPYAPEGGASAPVDIGRYPATHDGQVDATASYYVGGVDAGATYVVALEGSSVQSDLFVYDDTGFGSLLCSSTNAGGLTETCQAAPTGTSVWIEVDGSVSGFGSLYTLTLVRQYTAEGAIRSKPNDPGPVVLTLGSPHEGEVSSTASYYEVAVTPGSAYTATISNLTEEAYVYVYSDDQFTSTVAFNSDAGTGDKAAAIADAPSSPLYIKVVRAWGSTGCAYTLLVQ